MGFSDNDMKVMSNNAGPTSPRPLSPQPLTQLQAHASTSPTTPTAPASPAQSRRPSLTSQFKPLTVPPSPLVGMGSNLLHRRNSSAATTYVPLHVKALSNAIPSQHNNNNITTEEQQSTPMNLSPQKQCSHCEEAMGTLVCEECEGRRFCDDCFRALHKSVNKSSHHTTRLNNSPQALNHQSRGE